MSTQDDCSRAFTIEFSICDFRAMVSCDFFGGKSYQDCFTSMTICFGGKVSCKIHCDQMVENISVWRTGAWRRQALRLPDNSRYGRKHSWGEVANEGRPQKKTQRDIHWAFHQEVWTAFSMIISASRNIVSVGSFTTRLNSRREVGSNSTHPRGRKSTDDDLVASGTL